MNKLNPYDKYRPVTYDYISQLPDGWQLMPNIAIFQERIERGYENEELLSVTIGRGVIRQADLDKKDSSTLDKSKYLFVRPDDLVYSMRFRQGASGYSRFKGIVSPACTVLKPRKGIRFNPRYFHYMFRTGFYKNYAERYAYGIADGQMPLRYVDFKRMYSIVPPLEVQNSIVTYLDKKNNEIDKFIQNKERLIELLEEQRNYEIEKLLFSAYEDSVSIKNTGIEYLPNIPKHWNLFKIKFISKINPGKPTKTYSKNSLEEVVFLPMEKVTESGIISNELKRPIKEVWSGFTFFSKNDILLAKITPCFENGKGAFLNHLETEIGFGTTEFHVLRAKKNIEPMFLYLILRTKRFKTLGEENMQGSAGQQRVPLEFLKNFSIGIPPKTEQRNILELIQCINSKVDLILSKAKKEISSIKEYREALITDLITGKRIVPFAYKNMNEVAVSIDDNSTEPNAKNNLKVGNHLVANNP